METRCKRFQDISISEKMLYSLFLMTIGIGYLFALTHMVYTHHMRDGQPGISVQDVMIAYYGSLDQSRLGSAINGGPMEPNLKSAEDKHTILQWLQTGKNEAQYQTEIAPILARDCTGCHAPAINPTLPNLTSYVGVMEVAYAKAASLPSLVKVSHIHLFGIAFILLFVGRIFIFCDLNVRLKRIIVVIPFLAMLIDTMSWFITRHIPQFAYVVVLSGGLMGVSMGVQILISLYQMWVSTFPGKIRLLSNLHVNNWLILLYLARIGALFRLKIAPVIIECSSNLLLLLYSIYQIGLYKLHLCLELYAENPGQEEHSRINRLIAILTRQGFSIQSKGSGWLVRESLFSWRFLDSLTALEHYVNSQESKQNTYDQSHVFR